MIGADLHGHARDGRYGRGVIGPLQRAATPLMSRRSAAVGRIVAGTGAAAVALALLGSTNPAAGAAPRLVSVAAAAVVTTHAPGKAIDRKVRTAKARLVAASAALSRANAALDNASAKLPTARAAVAKATAAVAAAQQAEAQAQQQLAVAQREVDAQNARIAVVQKRIDALVLQIGALARQAYVTGGEQTTLALLLQTKDLQSFAAHLESERRTARNNGNLFGQAEQARTELANQLQLLEQTKAKAAAEQEKAATLAAARETARADALKAQQSVQTLVDSRAASAQSAQSNRASVRRVYGKLLAQQDRAYGRVRIGSSGTQRTPKQAVAWAMGMVGGGSQYNGLCLGFVDDAYGATGARQPRAIDQWNTAKGAGKGHPGDRNPPVGAQVFWASNNPARHIAIYIGGGMVISTGVDSGRVGIVPMSFLDGYGPYIGWAEAYYP